MAFPSNVESRTKIGSVSTAASGREGDTKKLTKSGWQRLLTKKQEKGAKIKKEKQNQKFCQATPALKLHKKRVKELEKLKLIFFVYERSRWRRVVTSTEVFHHEVEAGPGVGALQTEEGRGERDKRASKGCDKQNRRRKGVTGDMLSKQNTVFFRPICLV